MEKIAITEWNGIVSPVYDMACRLLILDGSYGGDVKDVTSFSLHEKSRFCKDERITTLLCGAISAKAMQLLDEMGIRVIPWICGPVERITGAYFAGIDVAKHFAMPGTMTRRCAGNGGGRWCGGTSGRHGCGRRGLQ